MCSTTKFKNCPYKIRKMSLILEKKKTVQNPYLSY